MEAKLPPCKRVAISSPFIISPPSWKKIKQLYLCERQPTSSSSSRRSLKGGNLTFVEGNLPHSEEGNLFNSNNNNSSSSSSNNNDNYNNNNNRIERRNLRFLQSHCAANCLQHVCSSGQGAIVCKSRATHRLIECLLCANHVQHTD